MSKIKITCPVCKPVLKGLLKYITDIKYIFTKDFKKENYYKHLGCTFLIFLPFAIIFSFYLDILETPILYQSFIYGLLGWILNFFRENYKYKKYGAPFSFTDINMGSYGGVIIPIFIKLISIIL